MLRSGLILLAAATALIPGSASAQENLPFSVPADTVVFSRTFADQGVIGGIRTARAFVDQEQPLRALRALLDARLSIPPGQETSAISGLRLDNCVQTPDQTCVLYEGMTVPRTPWPATTDDLVSALTGAFSRRPRNGEIHAALAWAPLSPEQQALTEGWQALAADGTLVECNSNRSVCAQIVEVHTPEAEPPYTPTPRGLTPALALCSVSRLPDGWGAPTDCSAILARQGDTTWALSVNALTRWAPPPPPPPPVSPPPPPPPPAPPAPPPSILRVRLLNNTDAERQWLALRLEAGLREAPMGLNAVASSTAKIKGETAFRDSRILADPYRECGRILLDIRQGGLGLELTLDFTEFYVSYYNTSSTAKLNRPSQAQQASYRTAFAYHLRAYLAQVCGSGPSARCTTS